MIARLGCLALLLAQQPPVFPTRVEFVYVDVFVTKKSAPVAGLESTDFRLEDAGVRQEVDLLDRAVVPTTAILVLDTSASVEGGHLVHLKEAARTLLSNLAGRDEAALVTFNEKVQLAPAMPPATLDWSRRPRQGQTPRGHGADRRRLFGAQEALWDRTPHHRGVHGRSGLGKLARERGCGRGGARVLSAAARRRHRAGRRAILSAKANREPSEAAQRRASIRGIQASRVAAFRDCSSWLPIRAGGRRVRLRLPSPAHRRDHRRRVLGRRVDSGPARNVSEDPRGHVRALRSSLRADRSASSGSPPAQGVGPPRRSRRARSSGVRHSSHAGAVASIRVGRTATLGLHSRNSAVELGSEHSREVAQTCFSSLPRGTDPPSRGGQEAGAEALPLWEEIWPGTCDEASRPACCSLAGASACSCP